MFYSTDDPRTPQPKLPDFDLWHEVLEFYICYTPANVKYASTFNGGFIAPREKIVQAISQLEVCLGIYDRMDQATIDAYNQWRMTRGYLQNAKYPGERPANDPLPQRAGYVYLLKTQGVYKIGLSVNPTRRLGEIQPAYPFPVELIHTIETEDMMALEADLHARFASQRLNGEWFELSPADLEYIKSL